MSGKASIRILTGPTACGKSAVALQIARRLNAEILSIDSMKVYRGLNVGTAKPGQKILRATRHHLIDICDPWESFSVAEFLEKTTAALDDCSRRGVRLIGEGGTPMYLKVLSEGLFEGPGRDEELRAELEAEAQRVGTPALHAQLAEIDPKAASKILPSDLRRIVRALEVYRLTGVPIGAQQAQWGKPREDMDVRLVCLVLKREAVYSRIDKRIAAMIAEGWLDECRRLLELPKQLSREASQALGYRTLFQHLRGEMTLAAAQERICFDTHHFARRQIGWFKRLPNIQFIEILPDESPEAVVEKVMKYFLIGDSK